MFITYTIKKPSWLTTKWVKLPTDEEQFCYYNVISVISKDKHRISSLDISDLFPSVAMKKMVVVKSCEGEYIVTVWNDNDIARDILPDFPSVMEFIKANT